MEHENPSLNTQKLSTGLNQHIMSLTHFSMTNLNSNVRVCLPSDLFQSHFSTKCYMTEWIDIFRKNYESSFIWICTLLSTNICNLILTLLLKMTVRYWIAYDRQIPRIYGRTDFCKLTFYLWNVSSLCCLFRTINSHLYRFTHKGTWITYIFNNIGEVLDSVMAGSRTSSDHSAVCLSVRYWPFCDNKHGAPIRDCVYTYFSVQ